MERCEWKKKAVSIRPFQLKYVSAVVNERRPEVPETLVSDASTVASYQHWKQR